VPSVSSINRIVRNHTNEKDSFPGYQDYKSLDTSQENVKSKENKYQAADDVSAEQNSGKKFKANNGTETKHSAKGKSSKSSPTLAVTSAVKQQEEYPMYPMSGNRDG
jgi:hypothetical protein